MVLGVLAWTKRLSLNPSQKTIDKVINNDYSLAKLSFFDFISVQLLLRKFSTLTLDFNHIRVVQTQAIFFLKSMSEKVGSDVERL